MYVRTVRMLVHILILHTDKGHGGVWMCAQGTGEVTRVYRKGGCFIEVARSNGVKHFSILVASDVVSVSACSLWHSSNRISASRLVQDWHGYASRESWRLDLTWPVFPKYLNNVKMSDASNTTVSRVRTLYHFLAKNTVFFFNLITFLGYMFHRKCMDTPHKRIRSHFIKALYSLRSSKFLCDTFKECFSFCSFQLFPERCAFFKDFYWLWRSSPLPWTKA